jgi:ABC-type multidrug transport system permease subunit
MMEGVRTPPRSGSAWLSPSAAWRIFVKELAELLHRPRGFAFAMLCPLLLVMLVGVLHTQAVPFRMLLVGLPPSDETGCRVNKPDAVRRTLVLLCAAAPLEVHKGAEVVLDPLEVMRHNGYDLVLDLHCKDTDCPPMEKWSIYTAATDPARLVALKGLIASLYGALSDLNVELTQASDAGKDAPSAEKQEIAVLFDAIWRFTSIRTRSLHVYFPLAESPWIYLLPMTISLLVCFLPFALAAPSLVREREARTLEIMLTAPQVTPTAIFVGKCLLPMSVALVNLLLMLVFTQTLFGVQVEAGVIEVVLFLLPAILASALAGLCISVFATSQTQTMLASMLYFLALALLTGFLLPLEESSSFVQVISQFLPLTFVLPVMRSWMFGAHALQDLALPSLWLLIQCAVLGVAAGFGFWLTLKRI